MKMTHEQATQKLREALQWALEWIDAVPQDTTLPAMPGFDRDFVNELVANTADLAPSSEPVAWMWQFIGDDPTRTRTKPFARALHEMDPNNPPYPKHWKPLHPLYAGSPPAAETVAQSIKREAAVRFEVEKLRRAEAFEQRVIRLMGLIRIGHKFDFPFTDAFDDGGFAYNEAVRRIAEERMEAAT